MLGIRNYQANTKLFTVSWLQLLLYSTSTMNLSNTSVINPPLDGHISNTCSCLHIHVYKLLSYHFP